MNYGLIELGTTITIGVNTFGVLEAVDADSVPSYRVYEDETGTAILTGSMAKLDNANTTGFYTEQIAVTSGNGFENRKSYTVYITYTISGSQRTVTHSFGVGAIPASGDTAGSALSYHITEIISQPYYELWLTTDSGSRIAQLDNILGLEASRVLNGIGSFSINLPPSFNTDLIQPDRMVQIWRQPAGGRLGLWQVYFIRRWRFAKSGSKESIEVLGPDINDLLRRRIVAAFSGSSQAKKSDFADDVMKEIVTESIADGVDPTPDAGTRVWSNLSIAGDLSLGPTITDSFPFDPLLTTSNRGVLPSLAKAAKEAGTEVFFDVVPNVVTGSSITFIFRTFTGQRGQDVSNRVIFDEDRGNMLNPQLEYDYTQEANYIYATGQGEEDTRIVKQVYDSDRYNQSVWGRIEAEADSRNAADPDIVEKSGQDALNDGRPRIRFSAIPVDTRGTRFGIDWNFGDKVQAKFRNRQFYCFINAVSISLNGNFDEKVNARLDFEGLI